MPCVFSVIRNVYKTHKKIPETLSVLRISFLVRKAYNKIKTAQTKRGNRERKCTMKETLIATYERESTLWKNANAFYKAQDWVKMECLFVDYSDMRNGPGRAIDNVTGEDITDSVFADRYVIRLTNKRGNNSKSFDFATREQANEAFKGIKSHKNLQGWKKVN